MMRTNALTCLFLKLTAVMSLTAGCLVASTFNSYADYVPQGGEPPRGGSTTSGMTL